VEEKHLIEYEGRLYCSKCGLVGQVGPGSIEILKDIYYNVLGLKCPNCKALWLVRNLD
jgi:hypothetical protein